MKLRKTQKMKRWKKLLKIPQLRWKYIGFAQKKHWILGQGIYNTTAAVGINTSCVVCPSGK